MTAVITHRFVSNIPDAEDETLVRPSNWNDTHILSGTLDVAQGGTGVAFLDTGFVTSNGTGPFTSQANILPTNIDLTVLADGVLYNVGGSLTGGATTTQLPEGDNLYYTDERVDDRVAALIQNGTGLTWTYNDLGNTLTGNVSLSPFSTTNLAEGTNLYYTDARARLALSGGTGISYNNVSGVIGLSVPVTVPNGGTGITSVAQGDILYGSATNTISTLTKDVSGTRYISNGGTSGNPRWEQIDLTNGVVNALGVSNGGTNIASYTQGDLLYASASLTISRLAKDTNATRYLSNTGTSNNPAWAQINLTNGVTGTLPVANGGTGTATAFTAGSVVYAGSSGVYSQDNANFFWDDTNNRLGIGTASPNRPIHISVTAPEMQFTDTDTGKNWHIGGNASDFAIVETSVANRIFCQAGGNIGFNGSSFGSGSGGVIFIGNCTAPTTNPSGGGLLYVVSGALRYKGSSGTVANLAGA